MAKTKIKLNSPPGKAMNAQDALMSLYLPNVFFQVTMTYALLRAGGVELGKMDFLGNLAIFDA